MRRLDITTFLKVIGVLALTILLVLWQPILHTVASLETGDLIIINDFLKVLLSWPVTVLILGLVFFSKFSSQIGIFLENIHTLKWHSFEVQRQKGDVINPVEKAEADLKEKGITLSKGEWNEIEQLVNDLTTKQQEQNNDIDEYKRALEILLERAENYEFAYLNLLLVENSKRALFWFATQPNQTSLKDLFYISFQLPPQIVNQTTEKTAILNVLLVNNLVNQTGDLFVISEKGKRFLSFIGINV